MKEIKIIYTIKIKYVGNQTLDVRRDRANNLSQTLVCVSAVVKLIALLYALFSPETASLVTVGWVARWVKA